MHAKMHTLIWCILDIRLLGHWFVKSTFFEETKIQMFLFPIIIVIHTSIVRPLALESHFNRQFEVALRIRFCCIIYQFKSEIC